MCNELHRFLFSGMETAKFGFMKVSKIRSDSGFAQAISFLREGIEQEDLVWDAEKTELSGMPFLAKDLFDKSGWPTRASSIFLAKVRPEVNETSALIKHLEQAGAMCVGKTHLNEFAYGLSGENIHFGDCPHPDDMRCLSGGSSSGSAYAVAKGWVPMALGTDTGGSIRVPASFCGVWGIRYTPGFLREGCFPLAPSFDTVGYFCRSIDDLRRIHFGLGFTPREPYSIGNDPIVLFDPDWCATSVVANEYVRFFGERGYGVDVALSNEMGKWMQVLVKAYSILQSLEALDVHSEWIDEWCNAYDPATYGRIERARHWTAQEIAEAKEVRVAFLEWIRRLFARTHCLIMPVVPCPSPEKAALTELFRDQLLALTTPGSMAGLCGVTEPIHSTSSGKTLGIQYLCPNLPELTLLLKRLKR